MVAASASRSRFIGYPSGSGGSGTGHRQVARAPVATATGPWSYDHAHPMRAMPDAARRRTMASDVTKGVRVGGKFWAGLLGGVVALVIGLVLVWLVFSW